MQSFKKIMNDLGFNKEAPVETQKAFIKNLIAAAEQTRAPQAIEPNQTEQKTVFAKNQKTQQKTQSMPTKGQLEFDLGYQNQGDPAHQSKNKKRVS